MTAISSSQTYKPLVKTLSSATLIIDGTTISLTLVSIVLVSGTVTITSTNNVGGITSDSITLQANVPVSFVSNGVFPISGITIDASGGGVCSIVGH